MSGHVSVLLDECIENLNIRPDGIYVDGTMGMGGHMAAMGSGDFNGGSQFFHGHLGFVRRGPWRQDAP